jgi:hypothetical protein
MAHDAHAVIPPFELDQGSVTPRESASCRFREGTHAVMTDKEKIKRFVQETLGCGCPGEVFRSIDCRRQVPLSNEVVLHSAITIGNRLLIYVAEAGNRSFIEKHLAFLVSAGKSERDSKGLNRFRLVMVTDESPGNRDAIGRTFEELREGDEKIHLHVIGSNDKYLDFYR